MKSTRKYFKRLIIIAAVFIICVLPAFITNTYSIQYTADDSDVINTLITPTVSAGNKLIAVAPETPTPAVENLVLYPYDISQSEDNGVRQIIKTYQMDAGESPDRIPKEGFENGGWQYVFTDLTRKDTPVNVTKEASVPVTVDSATKDIDEIIGQLEPTILYTANDGFFGILSLDISSINVEEADNPDAEADDPDTEVDNSNTETDIVSSYQTTAEYSGTLTKSINEMIIYSAYFTGIKITPTPIPVISDIPVQPIKPAGTPTKTIVLLLGLDLIVTVMIFFLYRRNIKVYNLNGDAYVSIGKVRLGVTFPVINLTPLTKKAVTGGFVLMLNRTTARRFSDKAVTINYGSKSFQHIIHYDGSEYQIAIDF